MSKGKYLSIYLKKKDVPLIKALDKLAKKVGTTRNKIIIRSLRNWMMFFGEPE